jgi:hypothetical protein
MSRPHYNSLFNKPWTNYDVVYQPSCLLPNYNGKVWPIRYPNVKWTDSTVVIMHCQDFVSIDEFGHCPELREIERHFGANAHRVVVVHWNVGLEKTYSGPMHLVYFPTHSYELLNNLGDNRAEWQPSLRQPRTIKWQSLNGIPRMHRRVVAAWLQARPGGVLSLGTEIPLDEWDYSTYFGCENELNWMRLLPIYSACDINIVTETMYTECPGIISEKTIMAILALQVPVVIGYRGIVQDCRDLGLDMFDDVVNNSYDLSDDTPRLFQALEYNSELFANGIDRTELESRLLANQTYLLDQWPDVMIDRYCQRCLEIQQSLTN